MLDDKGRWKYDPTACAELNAYTEANCHERIGDKIEEAMRLGNAYRVACLQAEAQAEFDFMVNTNGECASNYADVREAFKQYSALDGYDYRAQKEKSLEEQFDITWNEDGTYMIHPKGSMGGVKKTPKCFER